MGDNQSGVYVYMTATLSWDLIATGLTDAQKFFLTHLEQETVQNAYLRT